MDLSYQDFYRALSSQPVSSGAKPFSQLGLTNDNLSDEEQYLLHQKMLQDRTDATIRTMDPGKTWGGRDKNNFDPQDLMDDNASRWLRMEKI